MSYLLDTSVLTRLGTSRVRERVTEITRRRHAHVCAITALEIGFSARTAIEFDTLIEQLGIFESHEVSAGDFERALGMQRLLAERGHRGRKIPDLLIAAVAQRQGLVVVHYDQDFDLIAECTGQRTEWIVPRGEID